MKLHKEMKCLIVSYNFHPEQHKWGCSFYYTEEDASAAAKTISEMFNIDVFVAEIKSKLYGKRDK